MKNFKVFLAVLLALVCVAAIIAACNQTPAPVTSQGLTPMRIANPVFMNQTLNVAGDTSVGDDLTVVGDITAASIVTDGNATLTSVSTTGNITDDGDLTVAGTATLSGGAEVAHGITTTGVLSVAGQSTFNDSVYANAYLRASDGTVYVYDAFRVRQTSLLVGNVTISGTTAQVGAVTFSGFNVDSSASITPTNGGTLTPTARLVTLTPAGALGTDLGACTSGQITTLYNSVNANVVITDTGNGVLAGNQTLGQYDALPLACFDSKWVQTGPVSAN